MNAAAIANLYKRVAQWVGWPEKKVKEVSEHSIRVGATLGCASPSLHWQISSRQAVFICFTRRSPHYRRSSSLSLGVE